MSELQENAYGYTPGAARARIAEFQAQLGSRPYGQLKIPKLLMQFFVNEHGAMIAVLDNGNGLRKYFWLSEFAEKAMRLMMRHHIFYTSEIEEMPKDLIPERTDTIF